MASSYRRLNLFMAKPGSAALPFGDLLAEAEVDSYSLVQSLGSEGLLYVKRSSEKRPSWGSVLDELAGTDVRGLANRSSSAVLLLRVDGDVYAFAFGYGRHLIEQSHFIQDFGLRTALNTLDDKSLRSVDLHTLEDQPVQKKSQAARDSEVGVFGIDILRDILRAVTGIPKRGINLKHIAGGDAMFSFGIEMEAADLPSLARRMKAYYSNQDYKSSFVWVDNVRKIKDDASVNALNAELVRAISARDPGIIVTLPEIGTWDTILGFSFTRRKDEIRPVIAASDYVATISDLAQLTIEGVKRDRLFVHDVDGNITEHSVYRCIYFEIPGTDKTRIIFDGRWYEVDATFIGRITAVLDQIAISSLRFPDVERWLDNGAPKIEAEGDYNIRTASAYGYFLLDRKLIKTDRTTSSIELCDLLTPNKQLVHVKHRKGGSAGLSHLFAQGGVAAEIMLGDRAFRKKARAVLGAVDPVARDLVPLDNLRSSEYEIVFLILGDDSATLKQNLPFFSKVNLTKTYENLTQRGFAVSIAGAAITQRPTAP
jgi:uncharacterized protein (TIGR04141 family)